MAAPPQVPTSQAKAPSAAQVRKEFSELKHSLNEIASWELTHPGSSMLIEMKFTEMGGPEQAQVYASALQ